MLNRRASISHRRRQMRLMAAAGIACLLLVPTFARAQAIGGAVRDGTGSVVPGVSVEARSPALIEQVRTTVTDGSGQYLIVALAPGVYTVTYTLAGFRTVVREGIGLSSGFTANVDVELPVGSVAETVTVTQAAPLIDIQNVVRSTSIDRDVLEALPTTRGWDAMALFIPALTVEVGYSTTVAADSAGLSGRGSTRLVSHGSLPQDAMVEIDGFDVNSSVVEGTPIVVPFDTTFSEYVYDYSSNKAEIATGGVRMNMVPKEGGNAFNGSFYGNFGHSSWLANNIDEDLIARGIAGGKDGGFKMDLSWQVAPALGGPIMKDRLWFFAGYSYRRASFFPAGLFKSADTSALTYVPNTNEPSLQTSNLYEGGLRLTWRATAKDKVQAYYNYSHTQQYPALAGAELFPILVAPEAGIEGIVATHIYQISWVRPHTNRLLFEAGYGAMPTRTDLFPLDAVFGGTGDGAHFGTRSDLPGLFEISDLTVSRNIGFLGNGSYTRYDSKVHQVRASMSYVTGSHNVKVGFNTLYKSLLTRYRSNSSWTNAATFSGRPVFAYFESRPAATNDLTDLGIYAQDQWKTGRLTVNAGLRFDYSNNSYPDHVSMPGAPTHSVWVPQAIRFPGATAAIWKDLQPRLGVVYDLAGDGRTALKAAISRFGLQDAVGDIAGQLNPISSNRRQTRAWFDGATSHPVFAPRGGLPACIGPITCIPGDGLPQGDPLNPNPNGELLSATNNPAFGTPQITQFYDPDWAFGWGVKQGNWETSAGIQHQLLQNVSVDVGYFRRTYVNLDAWDNRSVGVEDFDTYTITVPSDPRLPGGGGYPLRLVDLKPTANLVQNNFRTNSEGLGGVSEVWHGVDVNFSARLEGVQLQGGVATGGRTLDYCAHQAAQPEVLWGDYNSYPASRVGRSGPGQLGGIAGSRGSLIATDFCRAEENWLTNVSVSGSYTFPYGIAVSAAYFSRPGPRREAMYAVPAADVVAALGRPATIPGGVVLNVIPPGTVFGDRLTQVDMRFAKVLDRGFGGNLRASLDIYNLFNENAVARERLGFSPGAADTYLVPIGVQPGRLFKISVQYNF